MIFDHTTRQQDLGREAARATCKIELALDIFSMSVKATS
jgi:hypothetical protein